MYFALGVLATGLLALTVTPAIWRRAARLTRARVESGLPMSLTEIQADRDQLRAGFAVETRKLEINVGRLEKKAAEQLVDLHRKREEIARLSSEAAARAELIKGLEGRLAILGDEFKGTDEKLAAANTELAAREAALAEGARAVTAKELDLTAAMQIAEEQQMELIALHTELGNLRDQLAAAKAAEAGVIAARDGLAAELSAEKAESKSERQRADGLEGRIASLEAERVDRLAALERRATELRELEAEIAAERARRDALSAEVARLTIDRDARMAELAENATEIAQLKTALVEAGVRRRESEEKLAASESALADAKAEVGNLAMKHEVDAVAEGDNIQKAIAAAEAEKTALETRLIALEEEFATLRAENAELRRVAGVNWEIERAENSRLRERLAEVAGNIVKLTQAVASAPTPMPHLAEDANGNGEHAPPPKPAPPTVIATDGDPTPPPPPPRPADGRSLAERIRALQHSTAARH